MKIKNDVPAPSARFFHDLPSGHRRRVQKLGPHRMQDGIAIGSINRRAKGRMQAYRVSTQRDSKVRRIRFAFHFHLVEHSFELPLRR